MSHDVIIVGASFAGVSAALQLARARRRILLIDAGLPRNRFAKEAHGILGHDGKAPDAIMAEALTQLLSYPTVSLMQGAAIAARKQNPGFVVALANGREERAARLILATGVRDELPAVAGLQERWGTSVLHCPYCHGYEVRDQQLGVLGVHAMSIHKALLIPDWGPTTYFTQGLFTPDPEQTQRLLARGVRIEHSPVVELLGTAPELSAVRLSDGRTLPLSALFTASKTHMVSPLAEQLGCSFEQGPTGPYLHVDELKATTVPGVYAAGDATTPMPNAVLAMASGCLAGVAAHQSLVMQAAGG